MGEPLGRGVRGLPDLWIGSWQGAASHARQYTRDTISSTRELDARTAAPSISNGESTVLRYEFQPAL